MPNSLRTAHHICYNSLMRGIVSIIPGSFCLYKKMHPGGNHSSANARFCYSFWLRLMVMLHESNCSKSVEDIAELGCAASIGIGIIAIISGSSRYTALELRSFDIELNSIQLFDELVELFKSRADIPDDEEFAKISIKLKEYKFPSEIFPPALHTALCNPQRLAMIRQQVGKINYASNESMFNFIAPWESKVKELMDSFDLVFSRAVMEHTTEVDRVYSNIYSSMKRKGLMFHDIEYNSHHTSKFWNGHWGFSNFIWKLIEGRRPMMINKLPHSKHAAKIVSSGFKLIADSRVIRNSELPREWIAKKYSDLTDEDLSSYGGWFLAEKN